MRQIITTNQKVCLGGVLKLCRVHLFASTDVKTSNFPFFFKTITVQIKCGWCYGEREGEKERKWS